MTFQSLNIAEPILLALEQEGYTNPTPIQTMAIPTILQGKDLLGCAQTGTGKTAAFAIPVLQQLLRRSNNQQPAPIRTLVLTPTRELAIQIDESFKAYGRNTKLRTSVIYGGVSQHGQTNALRNGIDILIATPGRLLDLMNQGFVKLNHLEILVLDEADRMLDMGFIHDIRKILKVIPSKRQTLFFSATMPKEIVLLSQSMLNHPVKVEVTPVSSTAETISQSLYFAEKNQKPDLLIHLLAEQNIEHALVFSRTKHGADKITRLLNKHKISAAAIHGNKSQNNRQKALGDFKDRTIQVLVATDIAARGIDVDDLSHVINYDIPNIAETYVHRIGRTGRAGANGKAISLCDSEERAYLKDIEKLINMRIEVKVATGVQVLKVEPSVPYQRPQRPQQKPQQKQAAKTNHNQTKPASNPNGPKKKKKRPYYGNKGNFSGSRPNT
jgi:ATP-dependent RNA helicase RhlE